MECPGSCTGNLELAFTSSTRTIDCSRPDFIYSDKTWLTIDLKQRRHCSFRHSHIGILCQRCCYIGNSCLMYLYPTELIYFQPCIRPSNGALLGFQLNGEGKSLRELFFFIYFLLFFTLSKFHRLKLNCVKFNFPKSTINIQKT